MRASRIASAPPLPPGEKGEPGEMPAAEVAALLEPLLAAEAAIHANAENLAANVSPRSTRIMKRQLWDALFVDLATSMQEADEEMRESLKSADFKEGVAHFLEKRPAKFVGG